MYDGTSGMATRPITWAYDVDPSTGGTYVREATGQWVRVMAPRPDVGFGFAPPPPRIMRDPTDAATWGPTGGDLTTAPPPRHFLSPIGRRP